MFLSGTSLFETKTGTSSRHVAFGQFGESAYQCSHSAGPQHEIAARGCR